MAIVLTQGACINHPPKKISPKKKSSGIYKKPKSNYRDSLQIYGQAAVFYQPDSLQLINIKAVTDSSVYNGTMHELFYQMRYARMVIKKTCPALKIIEAKQYRYLVFHKKNGTKEIIDLDTKNDAYGLFIFNQTKSPMLVDMTNIETQLGFYFTT